MNVKFQFLIRQQFLKSLIINRIQILSMILRLELIQKRMIIILRIISLSEVTSFKIVEKAKAKASSSIDDDLMHDVHVPHHGIKHTLTLEQEDKIQSKRSKQGIRIKKAIAISF